MITVEPMTNTRDTGEGEITFYIGLGSNLGNREANLREAGSRIEQLITVVRQSSIYETEPVGLLEQPWFLNQVIEGRISAVLTSEFSSLATDPETDHTLVAEALLFELLKIETEMGRERMIANGPRVIDIDLLLFGEMVIAHSKSDEEWSYISAMDVFVPHPRMHLRRFVLEPLCDIAPDAIHPVLKKTCREMVASLDDRSIVRRYDPARAGS